MKIYNCPVCGVDFSAREYLENGKIKESGKFEFGEINKVFSCKNCGVRLRFCGISMAVILGFLLVISGVILVIWMSHMGFEVSRLYAVPGLAFYYFMFLLIIKKCIKVRYLESE